MLFFLRKVAKHPLVGLIDKPNERKLHQGSVPLVGGISICLSILYFLYNNPTILPHSTLYCFSIVVLVLVGALDDKFDISFKFRLAVQVALALVVMLYADFQLANLGNFLGFGPVHLSSVLGGIITVFAVLGAINAFNMVDGIDGLLGGLASVTFGGLGFLFFMHSQFNLAYLCLVLIIIMMPYILLNLGLLGRKRKVFMGDAGSMLIGFTVIFLLIVATQPTTNKEILRPVTALWLIAIPLMDMAAIMYRRLRRGDSPFKPDRGHLHHIFQRIGYNSRQTLLIIACIALTFAAIGILGEYFKVSESIMFYMFVLFFLLYTIVLNYIWRVVKRVRSMKRLYRFIKRTHSEH